MSTIKSSDEHLTLNADGSSKDIKFQANGVEKASISSSGAFTSTTIDATKLTGDLPAISGANLTSLPADSTKLSLSGGTMTGNLDLGDSSGAGNNRLRFGAGNDLEIYHNGNDSYIKDDGDGDLIIRAGNDLRLQDPNTKAYMTCNEGGSVEIYFDNAKKLETLTTGIELYGNMEINNGFAITGEGGSTRLSVAHNTGNVWIDGNCSAASFTDRTPYPNTLQLAYDVINSHKKLPDGQYKADDHSKQLDHSQLHEYVKEEDNNRNMSGVISCLVEVIKDLSAKVKALEEA